ncbi:hypothetical protein CDD82_514 [Ophiocordyceps australis]|uniref:DUF6594 domain-containing protein n=1 Tax=Ophiocordyceps australis TaxID=1399860 RepID=A0A2C5ZNY9_9HYPO|nr:hypothetical protein CDD82_514 [Ophiocordyceps australis]
MLRLLSGTQVLIFDLFHMPPDGPPAGYALWASWISSDPDGEGFVFRRFDTLAATNLLYLQSDMMEIEQRLKAMDQEATTTDDAKSEAFEWETLKEHFQKDHPRYPEAKRRMDLILELRVKIKEYRSRVLEVLKDMMSQGGYPKIGGKAKKYLEDENDLVALYIPAQEDYLSEFLRKMTQRDENNLDPTTPRVARGDESTINTILNLITLIVAIFFLVAPIVTLYLIKSRWLKLMLVTVFTICFAVSVAVVTRAKKPEIFIGTATYAAVLVVFISSGGPGGG